MDGQPVPRGSAVQGFAAGAVENAKGPHPDVAYSWYVDFLEWVRDHGYKFLGPVVAITELVVGVLLIIGLFTGIAAFVGMLMNFSYIFAGTAGVNPLFIIISLVLIMAWRVAGWYGLDRVVLPKLGTPWQPGSAFWERNARPTRCRANLSDADGRHTQLCPLVARWRRWRWMKGSSAWPRLS